MDRGKRVGRVGRPGNHVRHRAKRCATIDQLSGVTAVLGAAVARGRPGNIPGGCRRRHCAGARAAQRRGASAAMVLDQGDCRRRSAGMGARDGSQHDHGARYRTTCAIHGDGAAGLRSIWSRHGDGPCRGTNPRRGPVVSAPQSRRACRIVALGERRGLGGRHAAHFRGHGRGAWTAHPALVALAIYVVCAAAGLVVGAIHGRVLMRLLAFDR